MIPRSLHIFLNSFLMYSPPLSVLTFLTSVFFCLWIQAIYFLNDSVMVADSLFFRKSMLVYCVFRSIHVMKYLYPAIDKSKGPHRSDTMVSPVSVGRSSMFQKGARVCLLNGQLEH